MLLEEMALHPCEVDDKLRTLGRNEEPAVATIVTKPRTRQGTA